MITGSLLQFRSTYADMSSISFPGCIDDSTDEIDSRILYDCLGGHMNEKTLTC